MRTPHLPLLLATPLVAVSFVLSGVAPTHAGGPDEQGVPPTELLGDGTGPGFVSLPGQSMIQVSEFGLRYISGQQNSRLTITEVEDGRLRYADLGTSAWKSLPTECRAETVVTGISAVCSVPEKFADAASMFLEVWPRLGNDRVNGSTLPARYRMWVLADAGNDVVQTGAGDDFVNGAQNADRIRSGGGDDWVRSGKASDKVWGGDGDDYITGLESDDLLYGEAGDDQVYGGPGNDEIWTGDGTDRANGGPGADKAMADRSDRWTDCESVEMVAPSP